MPRANLRDKEILMVLNNKMYFDYPSFIVEGASLRGIYNRRIMGRSYFQENNWMKLGTPESDL